MKYGFLIDHDRCIGCHACTVACKAENDVPVGNFRTWVKYVENGSYPDVRRHFAVLRCNHCTNAPCVKICPVNALEKRGDGIVDIDRDACIGCRACMQACPYDAIYLNEDKGSIEKCHYCAHRVEKGLEPACVIVCPETAIVAGDLDDPSSKLSKMVKENKVQVRRPEQKTGPNVYYKGALAAALQPGEPSRPSTYLWSDRPAHKPEPWPISLPVLPTTRVVLDAGHRVEWGWPVALYLVTKGVAAGAAILAPFAAWLGLTGWAAAYLPEVLAIVFTLATVGLLIEDLKRPHTFYRLLTRPNWNSWLVKGGIILTAFGISSAAIVALRLGGLDAAADAVRWLQAVLGLGAAGYTAFLFGQCEGRDLWQSPWLLPHLLVQAIFCGGAALALFSIAPMRLAVLVAAATLGHIAISLVDRFGHHATTNAKQAAAFLGTLRLGPFDPWKSGLLFGVLGAVAGLFGLWPAAAAAILVGLYLYEWAYVRAGQLPPLS
ncbi:MAG: polysulfide reductase NrfD [Phycisphaeraceae bacterium]|nr:polysulfide reductase NrfD [Phycisphaeraceae bacterium]